MTKRQRAALDRQVEFAQERTMRIWNREVRKLEAEYRRAEEQAAERRAAFRVVDGGS